MDNIIIELKDLSYKYPDGTKALNNINIKIPSGKKIAFLGGNGAGKSTLFFILNGVNKPEKGQFYYNGKLITHKRDELARLRQKVGIVFQDPNVQLFAMSVVQEISFGPKNLGLSDKEVIARVNKAMEQTDITGLKDKPTHFLSYGQKKRVSIADILAMDPEVIIMDEPTAGLDPKHEKILMDMIETLTKEKTIIMSTHDVNIAYSWADYVFVMNDGTLLYEGLPEDVFNNTKVLMEANLGLPFILVIYNHLLKNEKISSSKLPRTKKELIEIINGYNKDIADEMAHINFCLNYL